LPRNATIDSASLKLKGFFGGESYIATIDYYGVIYYTECFSDGTFGTPQLVDDLTTCNYGGTGVADFDNDGDFDFIVGSGTNGYNWKNIYYYEKIGAGPTFAPKRLVGQVYGYYPMDFAVGDFNDDDNMDFMAEGYWEVKARIFFGDGHGMFTFLETNDFSMYYSYGKSQGDLDEDGDVDIVIAGRPLTAGVYTIWWFKNAGDGQSFTAIDTGHAGSSTYGIVVGDYDNDGHLDILKADNTGVWYFLKGDGDGGFIAPVTTGINIGNTYAGYGDAFNFNIENDDNLDLICFSTYSTGYLAAYLGNGDTTFGSKIQIGDVGYNMYGISAPQFSNLGHVTNPKLDIGDDNSIDWSKSSEFTTTEEKDFTLQFKGLLNNPPTHISDKMVRDEYGNEFYLIPLNFTSDSSGYIGLEVDIEYTYKAIIDIKPDGDLASELNEYIENFDPNISPYLINITIPIRVTTTTAGKLKFSDLNILYNLP
ncbi:MAG: VCBS repeat-containing protein, partial [Thermoplasmata archaeon]|nr:VCBS repeat-containing protein [Thermoplasmata archaeon]